MGVGETLRRVLGRNDAGKAAAAAALAKERIMFHGVGLPAPSDEIHALGRDALRGDVIGDITQLFPREDLGPDFEKEAIPVIARRRAAYLAEHAE